MWIDTLYIEKELLGSPQVESILSRYPKASQIVIEKYGEVFNRKNQNFRLQKKKPALILAEKKGKKVLPTPDGYGIGGEQNFYFSHMLNCIFDCRYCFLQGMYPSANFVLFVNDADFLEEMKATVDTYPNTTVYFFSGYDCDSLALEPITRFTERYLPFFEAHPQAFLELRTKSVQIEPLLKRTPLKNVVIAFSLSPDELVQTIEHKTPSLARRLRAIQKLQKAGWQVGLRFDPLIFCEGYETLYSRFFKEVFSGMHLSLVHSASLGVMRFPKSFYKPIRKLYPREALFAPLAEREEGQISYPPLVEQELFRFCEDQLLSYLPADLYFPIGGSHVSA